MASLRFFRRSEARNAQKKNSDRKPFRRTEASRLSFETLESRQLLTVTTFNFVIPAEVASLGVTAAVYSNSAGYYVKYSPTSTPKWTDELISTAGSTLPLITLVAAGTYTDAVTVDLEIPSTHDLPSAEMFFFVGTPTISIASNQVSAPTVAIPNQVATIYNYGMIEFNYTAADGLDVDSSLVNSAGLPFTIVYPDDVGLAYPLTTLGVTLSEAQLNADYAKAFSDGGKYEAYSEFEQCATYAQQQNTSNLEVASPGTILAAEVAPPTLTSATATTDSTSKLVDGCYYYYAITAFSTNTIDGSDGVVGETLLSSTSSCQISGQQMVNLAWTQYFDPNTAGYNVYRYASCDSTPPSDTAVYSLIAHLYGATTTTYTDHGAIPQAKETSRATATNYGFNTLSEYYTSQIKQFFAYYEANTFSIHANSVLWIGNTVQYTPTASWNSTAATYTVLRLTAQNANATLGIKAGDTIYIYQPIFSKNTSYLDTTAPVMPSWMSAYYSEFESPSQMVFNCDGVFATNDYDPDVAGSTGDATALASIENCIAAAFNRGIATNTAMHPDNWAAAPVISQAPVIGTTSNSATTTTTYYYAVTAVNAYGETTPSLIVSATLAPNQSATLTWTAGSNAQTATSYKIYRGTSATNLTLLDTVSYLGGTSYTDTNTKTPTTTAIPYQYFTLGTTANWYAAFVQSNSVIDPVSGVSLYGLSYGFPYSDQGGLSSNIGFAPGHIPTNITVNVGAINGPSFVTQTLAEAVTGQSYSQAVVLGGVTTGTTFSSSDKPSWLTLDTSSGSLVLRSTNVTGTAGTYTFNIEAVNGTKSTTMQFSLTVVSTAATTPLSVAGATPVTGGVSLALADVVVNTSFTTYVSVTGGDGTGNYTMTLNADMTPGISFSGLSKAGDSITTTNGVFSLAGSSTAPSNTGSPYNVSVTITDQHSHSLHAVMYITVGQALAFSTSATLPLGALNRSYYQTLTTNCTNSAVTYAVANGSSLPSGLSLTPWGVLYGTPTATGKPFNIVATDGAGNTANRTFTLGLTTPAAITFTTTSLAATGPGASYDQTITVSGGGAGTTLSYAVASGNLPTGLSLTTTSTGVRISGTVASALSGGAWTFTLRATDSCGDATEKEYTINVRGVKPSTLNLNEDAKTFVIHGYFDATPSSITLSSGTIESFTLDSPTQITVTMTDSSVFGVENLIATVTMSSHAYSNVQVATVVNLTSPTVTANTNEIDASTTTLVIKGNYFDPDKAHGVNSVALSSGHVVSVHVDSAAQLTVTLSGTLDPGALTATVTVDGVESNTAQVATILSSESPTLDAGANQLYNTVTSVTLSGVGFQRADITDVAVVLSDGNITTFTSGAVTVASNYQLTVAGVNFNSHTGNVFAQVTVTTSGGAKLVSTTTQFATLINSSDPVIAPSSLQFSKTATGTTLVVNGTGFASSTPLLLYGLKPGVGWEEITVPTPTCNTPNQFTFTITDALTNYTQLGVHNGPISESSAPTQVAAVATGVPTPSITPKTDDISGHTPTITIHGTFDAAGSNYVTLYTKDAEGNYVALPPAAIASLPTQQGVQKVAVSSDGTTLTVTLAGVLPVGELHASVITDGVSTSTTDPVQIATVTTLGPIVTTTTTARSQSPTVIVITGSEFNTNSLNTVTLYTGDNHETTLPASVIAQVIANSSTQLTVILNNSTTLAAGKLWATVTVHGCSSGLPIQVAQIVASGPTVDFCSTNLSTTASTLLIQGVNLGAVTQVTLSKYSGSIDAVASYTVNTGGTQMTVTLKSGVLTLPCQLYATMSTATSTTSDQVQVANVTSSSTTPTINKNSGQIAVNATQLTITGTNFDATGSGANVVWLSSGTITNVQATSTTTLIVTLDPAIQPMTPGPITAQVTVNGVASTIVQVATAYSVGQPESTNGLYNPATGMFYLRNENTSGVADLSFQYGSAGKNWTAITGDWDNNGITTIGLYNPANGMFYLRNSNSAGVADLSFQYGPAGKNWTAITGDWDGNGTTTIGLYNQATGMFYLRNENSTGVADLTFQYGPSGKNWNVITGDWDGNNTTTTGLYNQATGMFYLRNENSSGVADLSFQYGSAGKAWTPLAGDWDNNNGSTIGLYNPAAAMYYLRNSNTSGVADITFQFGPAGKTWTAIVGHWGTPPTSFAATSLAARTSTARNNVASSGETATLTRTELNTIKNEAIERWKDSGVSLDVATRLEAAAIEIADLTDGELAVIRDGEIYLDSTAAGDGWFVDSTPWSDEEYTAVGTGVAMVAKSSTEAVDHIDLLTVIEQELGQIAGLNDLTDCIVNGKIGASVRSSLLTAT